MDSVTEVISSVTMADRAMLMKIMIFYALLSYAIAPAVGFYLKKNKEGIMQGMVVGSILSIVLWMQYGSKQLSLA
jgi:Na+/proline symporter